MFRTLSGHPIPNLLLCLVPATCFKLYGLGRPNILFTEIKWDGPDRPKWDGWLFLFAINSVPFYLYFTDWSAFKERQNENLNTLWKIRAFRFYNASET